MGRDYNFKSDGPVMGQTRDIVSVLLMAYIWACLPSQMPGSAPGMFLQNVSCFLKGWKSMLSFFGGCLWDAKWAV